MTPDQLRQIMPYNAGHADAFAPALDGAMTEFGITSPKRQAAFLSQSAEESGELRWMRELASGDAYEGRADLGNTVVGDGPRYRGGGLLMITGRANYNRCGLALNLPLVLNPSLIETPGGASRSAAWFWKYHGLNELADLDKFGQITHLINGGYNGLDSRLTYWLRARKTFGL